MILYIQTIFLPRIFFIDEANAITSVEQNEQKFSYCEIFYDKYSYIRNTIIYHFLNEST